MEEYIIEQAEVTDIPFLIDTIVQAEKAGSDKFSYSTLFNITEAEARIYLTNILEEELEGCELSVNSFLIAKYNGKPVAAIAAWVENGNGIPSHITRANLINFCFPEKSVRYLLSLPWKDEISIQRTQNTLQFESLLIDKDHRGKGLLGKLINAHIDRAKIDFPDLKKLEAQPVGNNFASINSFKKLGFYEVMVKNAKSDDILNYLPSNVKILMEKII